MIPHCDWCKQSPTPLFIHQCISSIRLLHSVAPPRLILTNRQLRPLRVLAIVWVESGSLFCLTFLPILPSLCFFFFEVLPSLCLIGRSSFRGYATIGIYYPTTPSLFVTSRTTPPGIFFFKLCCTDYGQVSAFHLFS
jgi:hypothetical protein